MAEDMLVGFKVNSKGYGTIPKLVMQDRNLSLAAKGLYAYFCSYTGGGDTCFPSRKKICFDLGISIDSFGKYLKQLIDNNYIECKQIKENGRFSHNVYTLCDTILPCPKISDTEITVYDKTDTNNNSTNNNSTNNNNNIDSVPTTKKTNTKFIPPTVEEVKAYCKERKNHIDPERFVAYYETNDWHVGRNKMKNWKSAIRLWETNDKYKQKDEPEVSYDIEAYESMSQDDIFRAIYGNG